MVIQEEHIYRWSCPICGRDRTAYHKQVPQYLYCSDCMLDISIPTEAEMQIFIRKYPPGLSPEKVAKILEAFYQNCSHRDIGRFRCDGTYGMGDNTPLTPLGRGEEIDLERMNFLAWYRDATVEEITIARRNGADRLDALKEKYAAEIELMDIING